VIGHEAVHKNCKRTLTRSARNLQQYEIDRRGGDKQARSIDRAKGQEISVKADI